MISFYYLKTNKLKYLSYIWSYTSGFMLATSTFVLSILEFIFIATSPTSIALLPLLLKYLSIYFTCEFNHSNIKNFPVTFCFVYQINSLLRQSSSVLKLFRWNVFDKKWISHLCSLKMFHTVIGPHGIYCYITLHPGQDFFSLLFGSIMLPSYQAHIFACLAYWQ